MEKFDINAVGAFNSFELISNKTCYKACGYSDDDLSRPIIGIANSYNEMAHTFRNFIHKKTAYASKLLIFLANVCCLNNLFCRFGNCELYL